MVCNSTAEGSWGDSVYSLCSMLRIEKTSYRYRYEYMSSSRLPGSLRSVCLTMVSAPALVTVLQLLLLVPKNLAFVHHIRPRWASCAPAYSATATTSKLDVAAPLNLEDTDDVRHEMIRSALSKMEGVHETETEFFRRLNKSVHCKQSAIAGAGQGLFAKSNVKSGTIVSFYPVHGMGVDSEESSVCIALSEGDQKHFLGDDKDANYLQYLIGSRPLFNHNPMELFGGDAIFVDANPNREDRVGWLSHYINDGATVTSHGEAGVLDYYRRSTEAKNCVHVPFGPLPIIATVATRKIKKGEELYTTYGGSYWDNGEMEVTEAIQEAAKSTAMDILKSMRSIQQTHQNEAEKLQAFFDS